MISHDAGGLALCESPELPVRTIIAPLPVVREIRAVLGLTDLDVRVGSDDRVFVSSDLFTAFNEWDAMQSEDDPDYELN